MKPIVAIATPRSPAIRGAVRISGDGVDDVLAAVGITVPPRTCRIAITLATDSPIGDVPADLMYWSDHRSYTGSPSAEIHTIGSSPVLDAIMTRLIDAGATPAKPGEFTLRAFLAGRLDLPQAEAVLGVIDSPGGEAFETSLAQLAGNLSRPLQTIRLDLIQLLADIEAGLDFVDEDIEFVSASEIRRRLVVASEVVQTAAAQLRSRNQSTQTPSITLRGFPNAGKSQLLNAMSGQQPAIVSSTAGTTRDIVSHDVRLGGQTVRFCDTAGIEDDDARVVSATANAQSSREDKTASIRLWCVDSSDPDFESTADQIQTIARQTGGVSSVDLFLATKSDLNESISTTTRSMSVEKATWIPCSGKTGAGLDDVVAAITDGLDQSGDDATGTSIRCRESFRGAAESIESAIEATDQAIGQELVAAEIREALRHIGEVTGEIYTDDILDQVFSRFCIGK